ncbi:hypothetical protein D3C78_1835490 [compost metagenome]
MHYATRAGSIIQRQLLRQQTANDTRQHISHATGCHASIANVGDRHLSMLIGDQGAYAFQHHNAAVLREQPAGCK